MLKNDPWLLKPYTHTFFTTYVFSLIPYTKIAIIILVIGAANKYQDGSFYRTYFVER